VGMAVIQVAQVVVGHLAVRVGRAVADRLGLAVERVASLVVIHLLLLAHGIHPETRTPNHHPTRLDLKMTDTLVAMDTEVNGTRVHHGHLVGSRVRAEAHREVHHGALAAGNLASLGTDIYQRNLLKK
jgi:hypothetical protein